MIPLTSDRDIRHLLRRLRLEAGLTQTQLGRRTHMTKGGVSKREIESRALSTGALIETVAALGFAVALVPQRHPGARTTGTGWPA